MVQEFPDFASEVQDAKAEFRRTKSDWRRRKANQRVNQMLEQGHVTRKWYEDVDGNILSPIEVIEKDTDKWVIEWVLGKPSDTDSLVNGLTELGVVPAHIAEVALNAVQRAKREIMGALFGEKHPDAAKKLGLSDSAIAEFYELLGIPQDSATLPGEVDSRPTPD